MLAGTMTMNPVDSLLATIQAFLNDDAHPGFGTITTSADMAEVEVTIKPDKGEDFRTFATRVMTYADGSPIEWQIQNRQTTYARVRRRLN